MQIALFTIGVVGVMMAVLSASLSLGKILVPLLESSRARFSVAAMGLGLVVLSYVFEDQAPTSATTTGSDNGAVADKPVNWIGRLPVIMAQQNDPTLSVSARQTVSPRLDEKFLVGSLSQDSASERTPADAN